MTASVGTPYFRVSSSMNSFGLLPQTHGELRPRSFPQTRKTAEPPVRSAGLESLESPGIDERLQSDKKDPR